MGILISLVVAFYTTNAYAQTTPTITLSVPAMTEFAEGEGNTTVTVTATLSVAQSSETVIDLTLGGTAKGTDYTVVQLPDITIKIGETVGTKDLTLSPVEDNFFEGKEEISIGGTTTSNYTVTPVNVPLIDNDEKPDVEITSSNTNFVKEGVSANTDVEVKITGGSLFEEDVTVTLEPVDPGGGYTDADVDFEVKPPWTLVIKSGTTLGKTNVAFTVVDDDEEEGSEDVSLQATFTVGGVVFTTKLPTGNRGFIRIPASDTESPLSFGIECQGPNYGLVYTGDDTLSCYPIILHGPTKRSYTLTATFEKIPTLKDPNEMITPVTPDIEFTIPSGANGYQTSNEPPFKTDLKKTFSVASAAAGKDLSYDVKVIPNDEDERTRSRKFSVLSNEEYTWNVTDITIESLTSRDIGVTQIPALAFKLNPPPRPVTLDGNPSMDIILDSGRVSTECKASNRRDVSCRYTPRQGDYDFDGKFIVPKGAIKMTGWMDANDPSIKGTFGTIPEVAKTLTVPGMKIYGGWHAIDFTFNPKGIQEGKGEQEITVIATKRNFQRIETDLTIPIEFTHISTDSSDFTIKEKNPSITIPAGQSSALTTVHLTPTDDLKREVDIERLLIEGPKGRGSLRTPFVRGAELTILDAAGIKLSVSPDKVKEDGGAQPVTVTAEWGDTNDTVLQSDLEIELNWGGTADTGDYTRSDVTTVTIPANARSGSVTVTITPTPDNLLEGNETIVIGGSTPGRVVTSAEITLEDDDMTPEVTIMASPTEITEGGGAQTITVSAVLAPSVVANDDTTVTLNLGGTAVEGTDYSTSWSPTSQVITIPMGSQTGSNTVTLILTPTDDVRAEGDKTIVVQGEATFGSDALVVKVAGITLEDNDDQGVNISRTTLTVAEGTTDTYDVSLGTQPADEVTISLSSSDATVATVNKKVLTFKPTEWDTKQTVTLTGVEDDYNNIDDKRETMINHVASGGGYDDVEIATLDVTVTDNDEATSFTIADVSAAEGDTITFTVSRAGATGDAVSVKWKTAEDTDGDHPASTSDYVPQTTAQTLSFAAGDTLKTFTVQTTEDTLDEDDETFLIELSEASSGTSLTDGTAIGTITDDDAPPVLSINSPSVVEGDTSAETLIFDVTLSPPSGRAVTVGFTDVGGGTATSGVDYTAVTAGTLNFDAGETSKSITVTVTGETTDEPNETVILQLSTLSNAMLDGGTTTLNGTGTIIDNDATSVTLAAGGGTVKEDGTDSADVTVSLGRDLKAGENVTVPLSISGTGITASDYTIDPKPGNSLNKGVTLLTTNPYSIAEPAVMFAGHDTDTVQVATLRVKAQQDQDDEGESESLTVDFGSVISNLDRPDPTTTGAEGTTTTGTATVTITDDDKAGITITESGDPASTKVSEDGTTTTDSYTVVLKTRPTHPVIVTVSAGAGVKVNKDGGTAGSSQTLTFNSSGDDIWNVAQTITVTGIDDDIDNADRPVKIDHSATSSDDDYIISDVGSVDVVVTDDDTRGVTVSAASSGVTLRETDDTSDPQDTKEDHKETYTVVLTSKPTDNVEIELSVPDGAPFTVSPLSLTFTPSGAGMWSTKQTITVTAVNDNIDNTGACGVQLLRMR